MRDSKKNQKNKKMKNSVNGSGGVRSADNKTKNKTNIFLFLERNTLFTYP